MIGGLKTEAGINRIIPINKRIEPFIRKYYKEKNLVAIIYDFDKTLATTDMQNYITIKSHKIAKFNYTTLFLCYN